MQRGHFSFGDVLRNIHKFLSALRDTINEAGLADLAKTYIDPHLGQINSFLARSGGAEPPNEREQRETYFTEIRAVVRPMSVSMSKLEDEIESLPKDSKKSRAEKRLASDINKTLSAIIKSTAFIDAQINEFNPQGEEKQEKEKERERPEDKAPKDAQARKHAEENQREELAKLEKEERRAKEAEEHRAEEEATRREELAARQEQENIAKARAEVEAKANEIRKRQEQKNRAKAPSVPPRPSDQPEVHAGGEPTGGDEPEVHAGGEPDGGGEPEVHAGGEPDGGGEPEVHAGGEPDGGGEPEVHAGGEPDGGGEPEVHAGGEPDGGGEPEVHAGGEPAGGDEPDPDAAELARLEAERQRLDAEEQRLAAEQQERARVRAAEHERRLALEREQARREAEEAEARRLADEEARNVPPEARDDEDPAARRAREAALAVQRLKNKVTELEEDVQAFKDEIADPDPDPDRDYSAEIAEHQSKVRQLQIEVRNSREKIRLLGDAAILANFNTEAERLFEIEKDLRNLKNPERGEHYKEFIQGEVKQVIEGYEYNRSPTDEEVADGLFNQDEAVREVEPGIIPAEQTIIAQHVHNNGPRFRRLVDRYAHEIEVMEHSNALDQARFKQIIENCETMRIQFEIYKNSLSAALSGVLKPSKQRETEAALENLNKYIDKLDAILTKGLDRTLESGSNLEIAHFSDEGVEISGDTPEQLKQNIEREVERLMGGEQQPGDGNYRAAGGLHQRNVAGRPSTLGTTQKKDPTGLEYPAVATKKESPDDGSIRVLVRQHDPKHGVVATLYCNKDSGGSRTRRLGYILPNDFRLQSAIDELREAAKFSRSAKPDFALRGAMNKQDIQAYLIAGRITGIPVTNETRLKVDISFWDKLTERKVKKAEERVQKSATSFKQTQWMSERTVKELEQETNKDRNSEQAEIKRPRFPRGQ